ncbi:MAG: MarC family protein [Acetobacter sp.]|jgi:multiple antibiotic resistance protein|nr:MarC family protein [Acetobacter sp.]MCH4060414.1 MarC family protein [Acetobacter sp.]MCH4087354.1 MarC family protein [Acetobacter sp.]MCI1293873.1 MarC family protein [Acetobacter sp.]MCI1320533.1 MarC family protein [Acetobacter sp.]
MWQIISNSVLISFPALFSIVNPPGASLIFLQLVSGRPRNDVVRLARQVALSSFFLLVVSIWVGRWLLVFFGVSLDALRVAGGLVVAVRAWALLQSPEVVEARREQQAMQKNQMVTAPSLGDMAFFPLTMPFTVGPGSIAVAIALSSGYPHSQMLAGNIGIVIASAGVCLMVWAGYTWAETLTRFLGVTGTRVVSRLSALILLCIGVQIISTGISGFVSGLIAEISQAK